MRMKNLENAARRIIPGGFGLIFWAYRKRIEIRDTFSIG